MEIKLRADEAKQHADDVQRTSEQIRGDLKQLENRLTGLDSSMAGRTREAFDARMQELQANGIDLMSALESLGQFLNNAADSIEDLDNQLGNSLG